MNGGEQVRCTLEVEWAGLADGFGGGWEEESRITGFWLDSWVDGWCYLL